jgi:hypothetical protein
MYQPERPVFRIVTSAGEAEEHLRVIRQAMERSTKHSTLSGLSGVLVGLLALIGYVLTRDIVLKAPDAMARTRFLGVWAVVLGLALLTDYFLTKRRAARVGKKAFSPLGKHLARAAAPGFLAMIALSLFYAVDPVALGAHIFGVWMLCYGVSLLSVGLFSVQEVSWLGWAFLAAGAIALLLPVDGLFGVVGPRGMMAVTFGGFHIAYGVWMGWKYGW